MLQNATPLRKSAPSPPNISDEHVSWTAPATENVYSQVLFKCRTPAIDFGNATKPHVTIPAKRRFNVQKWREHVVFCTFWPRDVLRATTACTFSTSQRLKVLRSWSVLCILAWKRATTACNFPSLIWPHGSAPAALASLLLDPPEPKVIGKTRWIATFLPFRAPGSSFFWDFLLFDILSSSLLFSGSSHLCFSSVHIVGSLTSKLPSMNK